MDGGVYMFDLIPKRKSQYDLFDMMDDVFKNNFLTPGTYCYGMKTDIKETEDEFILEAEMPGFDKKDISLELKNNYLTISALQEEDKKQETGSYLRRERRTGTVSRSFYVEGVEESDIKAKYDNGILQVRLPKLKKEVLKGRKLSIE